MEEMQSFKHLSPACQAAVEAESLRALAQAPALQEQLLRLGGDALVLDKDFFHAPEVLSRAAPDLLPVRLHRMQWRRCHKNSLRIHSESRRRYRVVTGYACATEEGGQRLWCRHTWVRDLERCEIIETTLKRDLYFGTLLSPKEVRLLSNLSL